MKIWDATSSLIDFRESLIIADATEKNWDKKATKWRKLVKINHENTLSCYYNGVDK